MNGSEVLIENYAYELGIVEVIISTNSELTDFKGLMMTKVMVERWKIRPSAIN